MKNPRDKTTINTRAHRLAHGTLLSLSIVMGTSACQPVDRWSMYQVEWDKAPAATNQTSVDANDADMTHVDMRHELPEAVQVHAQTSDPSVELPNLTSAGAVELSLEQTLMLTLANRRDLQVQQLETAIAGTYEQIERGVFDPELYGRASYTRERGTETNRGTGASFSVQSRETNVRAGVRQDLPTGTNIDLNVTQQRSISNRAPEQQETRVGMTVTQALLRGMGPAVNLARVEQARLDAVASRYELRGFLESLLAQSETAYWQYILAQRRIAIFERSLDVAKQQRDIVEQRIEVGVVAESEAAAARVEVARREIALIDARADLEARQLDLLYLISPPGRRHTNVELSTTTSPSIEPMPIDDLPQRLALAQINRPEIGEAQLRLEQDRLETMVTKNGLLPQLDLFITLGRSGFADTLSDSFRNIDGNAYDFTAGVELSQALGNRTGNATHQAAKLTRRQSALALENLRQVIQLEVQLAANEVERTRLLIPASTITRELEEQTVEAEQQRFEVGISTAILVAQAQRDLLAAQIDEVEAGIQYHIALVRLYLAEGSLLERRGIAVGN